uniref:Core domain-containing protein n=1 Tax=Pyramimonas obovata TaxID=1411642 RepID=A0A7S0N086_9CHLO|mmetsp:Transcript_17625/g.38455  ORF Transcript_17625/g.38455 Transcript_17625/m.38455 type:complete len:196 (+) Transcript_17625:210-797(+)|eukprot:CAMPEP_0118930456 /NCGR_PEP_ID=MMETSP1169-20130426/7138_1 /TAXON_ID=36882 /ORGANISM="Pyramimonas obovata, Strain CCMP722" /LENGTH=195 /DNA_ID=CAMNT_0006872815 /DNA_START=189 /DNA_END=776 /DNA_ORIENTATION=-
MAALRLAGRALLQSCVQSRTPLEPLHRAFHLASMTHPTPNRPPTSALWPSSTTARLPFQRSTLPTLTRWFSSEATTAADLTISDAAVRRIKELHEEEAGDKPAVDESERTKLRVAVDAGGCSGFQYTFELCTKVSKDDTVFERDGVAIIVDDVSLSFVRGATIDYTEEMIRASFQVVDNPNAESGCGCGASFSAK